MKKVHHERRGYVSVGAVNIVINGVEVSGSYGEVTCSCGWSSGRCISGESALAAFEVHLQRAQPPRRLKP